MVDNTKVNELQEKLLKAMDIVNAQALSSVAYDKTIICTIEKDDEAKNGKYEVTDGSTFFEAYSSDTSLKAGTQVYVIVPEGNFENQKMILGKKTSKTEQPFVYKRPFDNFFPMTENLAIQATDGALRANDPDDEEMIIPLFEANEQTIRELNIIKYTRLAISADFRSWVKKAVQGRYGILVELKTEKPGVINAEPEQKSYTYELDAANMYGNPYNFETWYNQQLVINLEQQDIGQVVNIRVFFYQHKNTFYDSDNNLIPYLLIDDVKLPKNLFVQNLLIKFGYDSSNFTEDYVEIYTTDRYSYAPSLDVNDDYIDKNKKLLKMRWVHLIDNQPFDMVNIPDNRIGTDYIVRWYKYVVGAPAADTYSSIYWTQIQETQNDQEFTYEFNPDVEKQQERIKAIVLVKVSDTLPGSEEQFIPYRSNELLFENERLMPPSPEIQHIANALTIFTNDETNGNYMLYGQDNKILDSEHSKKIRQLTPYFDINSDGIIDKNTEKITDLNHVIWHFPTANTMIKLISDGNYEVINLVGYKPNTFWYLKEETDAETGEIHTSYEKDSSPTKVEGRTYYNLNDQDNKYIPVTNWYVPSTYYLFKYIQCTENSVLDQTRNYYIENIGTGAYELVVENLTTDVFNAEKTKYWFLDYELDTSPEFSEYKEYHTFNRKNGTVSNGKIPQYTIDSYYSPSKVNNTITCEYLLNGVTYTTEKEFTFGPSGTMGTEQTLVIDFVGDRNAVVVTVDEEGNKTGGDGAIQFEVNLYDNQNQIQPIPDGTVTWSWYCNNDIEANETIIEENGNSILSINNDFEISGLYILQVKVGDLKTYFSIPIKTSYDYSYITGTSQVIYTAGGDPSYAKEQYGLFMANGDKIENVVWSIITKAEEQKYVGNINAKDAEKGIYKLQPLNTYVNNAPIYGVQGKIENQIVWTQPILVLQNTWPSAIINEWDGKTLQLNEEDGSILSTMIAAGSKNNDNQFTGVMIGDWSGSNVDASLKNTGVFGFHEGAMAYAFMDNGQAFIGKDGSGRIEFNGNKSTISSSGYSQDGQAGMMIDLYGDGNKPYIELQSASGKSIMRLDTADDGSTIELKKDNEKFIKISNSGNNRPLTIGDKFKVAWDGTITAEAGKFTGMITSTSGKIGGWEIEAGLLKSNSIQLNASANTIQVGSQAIINGTDSSIRGATILGGTIKTDKIYINLPTDGQTEIKYKYNVYSRPSVNDPWGEPEVQYFTTHPNMYEPSTAMTDAEAVVHRWFIEEIEDNPPVQQGYIGKITGNNGVTGTTGVGIKTFQFSDKTGTNYTNPIILESASNARLSAQGGIWLQANSSNNNSNNGSIHLIATNNNITTDSNGNIIETSPTNGRIVIENDHVGIGYGSGTQAYLSLGSYTETTDTGTTTQQNYIRMSAQGGIKIDTYDGVGRLVLDKLHAGLGFTDKAYLSMGKDSSTDQYNSIRLSGDGPIKIDSYGNAGGRFVADSSHVGIGFGSNSSSEDGFGGYSYIALYDDNIVLGAKLKDSNKDNSGIIKVQAERMLFVPSDSSTPTGYGRIVSSANHIGIGFGETTGQQANSWVALYDNKITIGARDTGDNNNTYSGTVEVQAQSFTVTGPKQAAKARLLSEGEEEAELFSSEDSSSTMSIEVNDFSVTSGNIAISGPTTITGDLTVSGGKIDFSAVDASEQTGIYARFA